MTSQKGGGEELDENRGEAPGALAKIVEHQIAPPRSFAPDLDPALEAICMRAIEREPGERYQSAEELGAALSAWLKGEATLPPPLDPAEAPPRAPSPEDDEGSAGAILLLMIAAGVLIFAGLAAFALLR